MRLLLWSAVYAIPALTIVYPLVEYDTGWHLATGRWIVEHRAIPAHDPFSTVPADRPWIAYSWLFGVLLYGVHELLGLHGILWLRTLTALAIVAAIHRFVARRQTDQRIAAIIVAAAALALTRVLVAERPGLFSILFGLFTLEAVECASGRAKGFRLWLWLLPLIYAIWANVHIQFVHGLLLLFLGALCGNRRLGQPGDGENVPSSRLSRHVPLLCLCLLATLVNPYLFRLYDVVITYSEQKSTYDLFEELKSVEFRHYADWTLLGMFAAACFALGRRRSIGVFELLVLAGTAYFSFHSRHDVWLLVLGSTLVLANTDWRAGGVSPPMGFATTDGMSGGLRPPLAIALATVVLAICLAASFTRPRDFLQKTWEARFPVAAADYIAEKRLPGPIWNPIHWGGYLIWRLPGYRVSIDGRSQLQGEERIRRSDMTWHGVAGWHDDPALLAAGTVVVESHSPLASLLRQDPRFTLVHEDALAAIFIHAAG